MFSNTSIQKLEGKRIEKSANNLLGTGIEQLETANIHVLFSQRKSRCARVIVALKKEARAPWHPVRKKDVLGTIDHAEDRHYISVKWDNGGDSFCEVNWNQMPDCREDFVLKIAEGMYRRLCVKL